jgi:hypothetical protein
MVDCSDITSSINSLRSKFDRCNVVSPKDVLQLLEVVAAVDACSGGGEDYGKLIQEQYSGNSNDVEVVYPVGTYHSISICVILGTIIYGGFSFNEGSVRNIEVTTTNQTETSFTVKAGSQVYVEYLIKTKS